MAERKIKSEVQRDNLEQFILCQNLTDIASYHKANEDLSFRYRMFRQVEGSTHNIVSRLSGTPDLGIFKKIRQSVLSLMQPKLRIFKVVYVEKQKDDESDEEGKVVALPFPRYSEFKFSSNFGVETAATVSDYLSFESVKPSARNVGIKSFSFEDKGEALGPFQKEITAKLTLVFKSLKDIQAQPPGEPPPEQGGLRYFDLFAFPGSLITGSPTKQVYNPKHYQIKVLIGWTAPSKEQLAALNLPQDEIDAIAKIENLNRTLSLILNNYSIDIKDDGQVHVNIDYRSFIDSALDNSSASIFNVSYQYSSNANNRGLKLQPKRKGQNINKIQDFINILSEVQRQASSGSVSKKLQNRLYEALSTDRLFHDTFIKSLGGQGRATQRLKKAGAQNVNLTPTTPLKEKILKDDLQAVLKVLKTRSKRAIDQLKAIRSDFRKQVFSSFMSELIKGNDPPGGVGSRLFVAKASPEIVKDGLDISMPPEDEDDSDTPQEQRADLSLEKLQILKIDEDAFSKISDTARELVAETEGAREKKKKDKTKNNDVNITEGDSYQFPFIYFGDIVELACRNANLSKNEYFGLDEESPYIYNRSYYMKESELRSDKDEITQDLKVLLGPVEYYDLKRSQSLSTINLAAFPISFNLFRAWFLKNVVSRNNIRYSVDAFIKGVLVDLVYNNLGNTLPTNMKPENAPAMFLGLTLPGKSIKSDEAPEGAKEEYLPSQPRIDVSDDIFKQNYVNKISDIVYESKVKNSYDYILYYISNVSDLRQRRGNAVEDEPDGIVHYNIGSDRGMLKNISFKKEEVPFRAEQLHERAQESGDDFEQLIYPYSSDLKLIGVPFYKPGMLFYVNPTIFGLGAVEDVSSVAHKLNLGGYNMVLNVKMSIRQSKFETTLTGFQQGHGRLRE